MIERDRSRQMARAGQRGLSLVELMVGITIGLFIILGALLMITSTTSSNRNMLVETRLIQDLRAASDLVARDLRRAGYWGAASSGVYVVGASAAPPLNAYRNFIPASCSTGGTETASPANGTALSGICYYIAQDNNNTTSDPEKFGFALGNDGVISAFIGGTTAQPLTDPKSLFVDTFRITPMSQSIDMSSVCTTTPPTGTGPVVVVRMFDIDIRGYAPSDPNMIRGIQTRVKVRNDAVSGACP